MVMNNIGFVFDLWSQDKRLVPKYFLVLSAFEELFLSQYFCADVLKLVPTAQKRYAF